MTGPNPLINGMGAAGDLGLTMMDGRDPMDILDEQKKKRVQQAQQAAQPRPFMGAAGSLLNPAGNQY